VDECATGAHKCHVQARCLNTPGSYECKCLDNLSGNGYICNERAAFKDDPTTQRVKTNSIVTLSCSYYNSSSVEFHWIKDGQVLNTSKYITEVKSTRGSQNVYTTKHDLKFNISSIAQQGRYWCRLREGSTVQKDSRIAAVILKDASATELPMEIKKTYNKLWNDTGSPEHQELKGWITDAIKKSVGTGSLASRKRRNVQNSDPFVQLTNIRSSSSGTTLLNAMVYYKTATRDSRLAVCNAMQNISSSPLSTSSIQITVTARKTYDCCYSDFTGNPDIKGVIYWPTQVINERSIVGCPATITKANATRYCVSKDFEEEPVWQSPNTSTCLYVRETTQKLSDLTKATVNATTVVKIVKELEEVTKNETNIKTYLDVAFAVDVIVNVADSQSNNTEAFDGIMNVTSSLMSADANVVKDAQKDNNASARLMKAVEKFADNIPLGQNETTKIFSKKNLAIGITEITAKAQQDLETSGFVIKGNIGGGKTSVEMIKEKNEPVEAPAKVADLKLPGPLFKVAKRIRAKSNATDALRVTTLLYDNAKLFSSESTSGTNASKKINSKVLAVGIKGIKLENLTEEERVRSEFRVQLESQGLDLCVYWEEIEREWSQRGCRYDGKSATDNKIGKCSCNHMTNFALLLDVTQKPTAPPEGIKEMLKYFTYIGCGLSLAGLTITLLTLCFFKKVRQKPPQKIIMGVCISLILALIAFLVASQHTLRFNEENGVLTPASPVVCLVSSVAIHYFVVCSFLWMAMQSYYLYLSCVKVMNVRSPNILKWMALISFGIPLVIVAIVLGVQNKEVKKFADQEKVNKNQASSILLESNGYVNIVDKSNRICMINGISFYVAYLVPIGLILIINFVFLVLSIRGIFGSAQKTGRKGLSMKRKFRIILSCVTMMGLTWLIGMFAIGPLKIALQVLFTIFNSLQGVLIFLFYCLLNKKVQEEWRACLFGGERSDSSVPSSKKTSVKSSEKRHKRRSLLGKKEHTSSSMQSVSKQDEYKESILALQKDFVGKEYRLEGVFANLEDRRAVLSYMGPLDDSAHGGSNTAPDRDPHLSTTV